MFKLESKGAWLEELKRRQEQLRAKSLTARLRVSDEVFWWYIQEFGSASRGEKPSTGLSVRDARGYYEIKPQYARELIFPGNAGDIVHTAHVWHPGVHPQGFVRAALQPIREEFAKILFPLVAQGQMDEARVTLLDKVMKYALDMIVLNIEQSLRGTRSDGRLGGRTAAESFEQGAEIVDMST